MKHPCLKCNKSPPCSPYQQPKCKQVQAFLRAIGRAGMAVPIEVTDLGNHENQEGLKPMSKDDYIATMDGGGSIETRICENRLCPHKGEPQPIFKFKLDGRVADGGRRKTCIDCETLKRANKPKRKSRKPIPPAKREQEGPITIPAADPASAINSKVADSDRLILELPDETFDRLEFIAKCERRCLKDQVCQMIDEAFFVHMVRAKNIAILGEAPSCSSQE